MPSPLDYQPRDEAKPDRMSPSDWGGWIVAGLIIFTILACAGMAIT